MVRETRLAIANHDSGTQTSSFNAKKVRESRFATANHD